MGILENVFTALEGLDRNVRRVADRVRGTQRGDVTPAPLDYNADREARKAASRVAIEQKRPLGDAAFAVQIFGRVTDPWTGRATRLLKDRSIEFAFTDLDAPGNERLGVRLESETQQHITPYVYIRGEFVGGFNALDEIERLGQLDEMVKTEEERAAAGDRGVKIVIPKRGPEEAPPGAR